MTTYQIGKDIERLTIRLDSMEKALEEIVLAKADNEPSGLASLYEINPTLFDTISGHPSFTEHTLRRHASMGHDEWPSHQNGSQFIFKEDHAFYWISIGKEDGSDSTWMYHPGVGHNGPEGYLLNGNPKPAAQGFFLWNHAGNFAEGAMVAGRRLNRTNYGYYYSKKFDQSRGGNLVWVNDLGNNIGLDFHINDVVGKKCGRRQFPVSCYFDNRGTIEFKIGQVHRAALNI